MEEYQLWASARMLELDRNLYRPMSPKDLSPTERQAWQDKLDSCATYEEAVTVVSRHFGRNIKLAQSDNLLIPRHCRQKKSLDLYSKSTTIESQESTSKQYGIRVIAPSVFVLINAQKCRIKISTRETFAKDSVLDNIYPSPKSYSAVDHCIFASLGQKPIQSTCLRLG